MVFSFGLFRIRVEVEMAGATARAAGLDAQAMEREFRQRQVLRAVEQELARWRQERQFRIY